MESDSTTFLKVKYSKKIFFFVGLGFVGFLLVYGGVFQEKYFKVYSEGLQPFRPLNDTMRENLGLGASHMIGLYEDKQNETKEFDVLPFPFDSKCFERLPPNLKNINESRIREDFEFLESEEGKQYKKILIYYDPYHNETHFNELAFGNRLFEESCCKEKRCFLTLDKTKLPVIEYDAVLIHLRGLNMSCLPKEREKYQRWIMLERESPAYSTKGLNLYNGLFNWTMTYRRDSDVLSKYGYIYQKNNIPASILPLLEGKNHHFTHSIARNKTKMAAWLVSHCETLSGREMLVRELQKYIDIDVYGRCGPLKCGGDLWECYRIFESNYKFYLSFENSICEDYITEKFFNVLQLNLIPVVFGAGDYSAISPPHSYIDARSFASPKKLAEYLLYLSGNEEAYLEYFKWKDHYITSNRRLSEMVTVCHLCQKLHEDKEEKIYFDIKDWFLNRSHCKYCTITPGVQKVPKCYNKLNENINIKRLYLRYPSKWKKIRQNYVI